MNEQLVVKNFGPITDATVDFKRVTVFIGPTGGGKSTLAKLAAVFRDIKFHSTHKFSIALFDKYSISAYFQNAHYLSWGRGDKTAVIENRTSFVSEELASSSSDIINSEKDRFINAFYDEIQRRLKDKLVDIETIKDKTSYKKLFDTFFQEQILSDAFGRILAHSNPEYIPSERTIIASLEYSWAGLMRDDIGLPKPLLDFANSFSLARKETPELDIPFFNVKYLHIDGRDFIKIPDREEPLMLLESASGIQSVTPLLVLLEHLSRNTEQAQSFIIEEPELNLYPTAQQGLLNWLVEKCTKGENDLTITTHSPYILSHLNLMLYAYQVAEKHPDQKAAIAAIVPEASWINPKEFACYQVEGGGVHSLVDAELGLIDNNALDNISGDKADAFDQLININRGFAHA